MLSLDLELHCGRSFRDRGDDDPLNLTNCSREGHHPNATRAETTAGGRAGIRGRSGRVHVVDDAHVHAEHAPRATTLPRTLRRRSSSESPRCRGSAPDALEHVSGRDAPDRLELARKPPRRDVATLPRSLGIARHGNEAGGRRLRDRLRDELRQPHARDHAVRAPSSRARRLALDRRRRSPSAPRRMRAAARALGAAPDRPRPRRAAALAHRRQRGGVNARRHSSQSAAPGSSQIDAALRQEEVQRPHTSTVRARPSRLRVRWVPRRARAGRPPLARDPPAS